MRTARWFFLFGLPLGLLVSLRAQTPAPLRGDFDDASLREWVQPDYPEAAKQAKLEGEVVVEFVVEIDGHVSRASVKKSSDEQFNASALAAVQRWVFASATVEGKPAASGMQVTVKFKLAQLQQKKVPVEPPREMQIRPLKVTQPKLSVSPTPDYPVELDDRKLPGQVVLEFTVETDGTASAPKVLWASHAAFVGEALRSLEKYRFEPAHQGPLALKFPGTPGQMEFESVGASRMDLLTANQISVVEPDKFRQPPRPTVLPEPVYPRDLLLAGETGSATVEFTVTDRGMTTDVLLREASRPEFGSALIAAVEAWVFDAALLDVQPAAAKLVVAYKFVPSPGGSANRLTLAMQPGGAGVGGAGGLDARIQPIWRVRPVYPQALQVEKPIGKAMIEFIIDSDGRARLPRVVSASREEFGWAAATAVSQWVFNRPLRAGQPADVNVSIPIDFVPSKE